MNYHVEEIEKKWQQRWQKNPVGTSKAPGSGKKFYCLDMFPYPSGSGLHVGHWRGYVLSDVYTRIKWLQGYNILHPMGWDAFGLPAENDALKKGIHPTISTAANIAVFKRQLQEVAALYDWSKELNTTDPEFYRWTQWIFLKMYKAGLAYQAEKPINWCPSCLTGLANEEVINGRCERCGAAVELKNIRQWVLRITAYAEKLLAGLDALAWPEKVKMMQRNWIGKSEGASILFTLDADATKSLEVFTTSPQTVYGVTFLAIAYDHALTSSLITAEQRAMYENYHTVVQELGTEKKYGFFTGSYGLHPLTGARIPIWVTNYVLAEYGTGVVMGVPGHDERDNDFAQTFHLPIVYVVDSPELQPHAQGINGVYPYTSGTLRESDQHTGLSVQEGYAAIIKALEKVKKGHAQVTYKLRDWLFSRQRYWGEPIPIIHCPSCGVVPVPEDQLPVKLPDVEKYQPSGTGESPLATIAEWINVDCPVCGAPSKRETNTMPQWAGSSWYFLRYPNPHDEQEPFSKTDMNYWLPVDLYVGGIEHAILHLLYARFYVKVLHDLGYLSFNEPFTHLFNQGMVNKYSEKSGAVEKMSKSKGNVVNPDDIVKQYGSDVLRMYILFMGPPELDCEWQDNGLLGIKRFAHKLWAYLTQPGVVAENNVDSADMLQRVNKFLKDFQERIDIYKPNTALASFMEFLNDCIQHKFIFSPQTAEKVCVVLSCMAPHMASELLEVLLNKNLQNCSWPVYDPAYTAELMGTLAIQVNGKLRGTLIIPLNQDQELIIQQAQKTVASWLAGKQIVKTIYAPGRMVSFVVQ